MAPKKRAAKKSAAQPAAKRQRKSDDSVWCTTSRRSPLVKQDLYKTYSDPKTYEHWTKADWDEARMSLPDDAPYNEDGYSVPMTYFKYDVDWRRYVREFQEDLAAGRYEPEWQAQAKQAMEERARGDFDKWKADQFEQFWGQKQKTSSSELAGESAQISLSELIEHRIVRVGDTFSYTRVFGRGKDRIMIEKDAKVHKIDGTQLTMTIPPGQLKYARYLPTPDPTPEKSSEKNNIAAQKPEGDLSPNSESVKGGNPGESASKDVETSPGSTFKEGETSLEPPSKEGDQQMDTKPKEGVTTKNVGDSSSTDGPGTHKPHNTLESSQGSEEAERQQNTQEPLSATPDDDHVTPQSALPAQNTEDAKASKGDVSSTPQTETKSNHDAAVPPSTTPSSSPKPVEDVIMVDISTLTELERQMCKIDGRVEMKGWRSANSWKAIRGKRDNQDMGSLFDMREDFYVNRRPDIVKMPKTSRRSGRELKPAKKG